MSNVKRNSFIVIPLPLGLSRFLILLVLLECTDWYFGLKSIFEQMFW